MSPAAERCAVSATVPMRREAEQPIDAVEHDAASATAAYQMSLAKPPDRRGSTSPSKGW